MAAENNGPNGWNEWGRHVLSELNRLNDNIETTDNKFDKKYNEISKTLSEMNINFVKFKVKMELKTGLIGLCCGAIVPGIWFLVKVLPTIL